AAGGCTAATCPMVPDECPINETYVALNSTSGNCSSSNSTCSSIIQTTCKNCPTTTTSCGSSTSGGKAYCYPCASYLTTNLTGLTLASTASYPNSGYPAYNSNIPGTTVAYSAMCSPTPTNGGVMGPGYCLAYAYTFSVPASGVSASGTASFQAYLPSQVAYNICGGAAANFELWADYELYNSTCSSPISCGNFSTGFNLAGVACSNTYTLLFHTQLGAATYISNDLTYALWPFTTFSQCNQTTCSVLPINLFSFGADYQPATGNVIVDWTTFSQINNKLFTVERSA